MNVQLESFVSLLLLVLVSFPYCFADNGHVEAWDQTTSLLSKRASSCAELWLKFNLTQTGNYTLDLGLDQRYSEKENLITVECELNVVTKVDLELPVESLSDWSIESHNEIMTVIHHDSEETKLVQGFESPGSYINDVNYYGTNSISQIEHIIASSFTCQQFIRWECRGSTFSFWYPKTHHNWWVDRHGIGQNYWGNAEPNSNSCGCFPNCYPTVKNSTCNCDANLKTQWLEDSGLLLESKHLPVTQLRFGDTGESYEVGKYTLGPLVCRHGGHRRIFLGNYTAPVTITSPYFPERYPPPFRIYEWDIYVSANDLIELVFPEYDIVHYGAYNSVPGCRHALEVDIYIQQSNDSIWKHLISIKREKSAPPYYVTDGRATKFVLRLITCNQVPEIVLNHKGFKGNFRRSKCAGCNLGSLSSQNLSSITSNCFIDSLQCIYIHSTDYPFPHYLYGPFGYNVLHTWNLTTHQGNILQIEFNDFDVNSTPGQNNCDADLLTLHELLMGKLIKKVDYCNINRFNIGKFHSHSNHAMMVLKTKVKKVGNSRGIHATVRSIPETKANIKWVRNAAEGKPTDQSSTRDLFDSSFAVDGNYAQYDASKCSSTNYEREPWWRVNLQKRHRIHGVQIYSLIRKQPEVKATLGTLATISDVNENFFTTINTNDENIQWPMGEYALPMPVSGCPQKDSNYQWLTGMRFHAVQHDKPYDDKIHYWSESIMLKGGATGIGIEQHFCAHTMINNRTIVEEEEKNSSRNMEPWMPGKYCIFQYGNVCPEGFHPGSITWFDKSHNNQTTKLNRFNSVHGNVPSGEYTTHNTTINFCCREDGNPETPIRLPKTRPFYLLQYGYICQEVEGMSEVEHSFHYEEEVALSGPSVDFIFTSGQKLKFQDPHPRVDATLFDRGLSLHYCYYDITDKLKGFQVLVDTTPDTFGYGRSYDENSGIARPVNKQFLSAVECASYHVNANEFEQITLNCTQPIEGQYVIIFMKDRKDALQLCEVRVFGEESCGRPLGMATEEVLDSAIAASSFDQTHGLLYHPYNVRLNSPKAWCASNADSDKYIQIDLRLQNSNIVIDSKSIMSDTTTSEERTIGTNFDENHNANYVTIVGVAMQGMQMTFKSYFVTQFQLLFSNDSMHWIFEEEPIGKQKIYKCVQCDAQHIDGNEIVMYNLLKPIVARFIRIKILAFRLGPCMRLDLIGCRGDKRNYCSRELTASTPGVISSPNYPFYYAQFKSCVWKIKPSNHSGHIEIDFIILDLAPAEKSGGKCHDQLLIFHSSQQSAISIESGTGSIQRQYSFGNNNFPRRLYRMVR
ncbi:hypothetical protein BLOT_002478 [Blomia tropicalis]|nr:hypothetical protein BLOT_002478 [Blomia tropicalis]